MCGHPVHPLVIVFPLGWRATSVMVDRACVVTDHARLLDSCAKEQGIQTPTTTPERVAVFTPYYAYVDSPLECLHPIGLALGNRRSSQRHYFNGQEERCSGYFSCFVIREIITCLPAPLSSGERRTLPTVREQRYSPHHAQHCA